MGNDNKINAKNQIHEEVKIFLGDELKPLKKHAEASYNLVNEYEKTRHNRNKSVWFVLAGCFAFVALATFAVTKIAQNANSRISINIDTFDDLNLSGLLDSVGRTENRYETAERELLSLELSMKNEIDQAKQKYDNDMFTLDSVKSVTSKSTVQKRQKEIKTAYERSVQKIHGEYDAKIEEARRKVDEVKKQLDSYDEEQLNLAQSKGVMDSQKQLNEMERKDLSSKYDKQIKALRQELVTQQIKANKAQREAVEEVRRQYQAKIDQYDPKAREQSKEQDKIIGDIGIALNEPLSDIWKSYEALEFDPEKYTQTSENPSKSFTKSVELAKEQLEDLNTIGRRFKPIPMENSIKDYVPAIMRKAYMMADTLATGQTELQAEIDDLNTQIAEMNTFAEQMALKHGCDAIVTNSSRKDRIVVYVIKEKQSYFNSPDYVQKAQLKDGRKLIADGILVKTDGKYIFTPNDVTKAHGATVGMSVEFVK